MSTAIHGFGQQVPPATSYTQSLSIDAQEPAGGPKPPPATVHAAFSDSRLATDTFTPSQAASVLLSNLAAAPPPNAASKPPVTASVQAATPTSQAATTPGQTTTTQAQNPVSAVVAQINVEQTPVKQFQLAQGPPPFTLRTALKSPNSINRQPLYAQPLSPFQIRQFSDLIKTLKSVTTSVLPQFSYSA